MFFSPPFKAEDLFCLVIYLIIVKNTGGERVNVLQEITGTILIRFSEISFNPKT